ncbi:MAG: sulfocyanin-like copper-binding protein [Gemmatimonadales bacterium]
MMRPLFVLLALPILFSCGGDESPQVSVPAESSASAPPATEVAQGPTGALTMPDWYSIDDATRSVHLTLKLGTTAVNNYWNFHGTTGGAMAITVPLGYEVTVDVVNADPNMGHGIGVAPVPTDLMSPPPADPAFAGAITDNPRSMIDSTMPGESETFRFVADVAGPYALVCHVPGHLALGMWARFNVSASGERGVQIGE